MSLRARDRQFHRGHGHARVRFRRSAELGAALNARFRVARDTSRAPLRATRSPEYGLGNSNAFASSEREVVAN